MIFLVVALLTVVAFFWLVNRSVTAGHGKFLFWLAWFIGGICALLALPDEYKPVAQILAWVWAAGWLGLPLYCVGQKILRQHRRDA